jgi:hypothetical protein
MTGVYFDGDNMVGTDAHRLRVISAPSEGSAILCKEVATLLKYSGAKAYKNGRVELDGAAGSTNGSWHFESVIFHTLECFTGNLLKSLPMSMVLRLTQSL